MAFGSEYYFLSLATGPSPRLSFPYFVPFYQQNCYTQQPTTSVQLTFPHLW